MDRRDPRVEAVVLVERREYLLNVDEPSVRVLSKPKKKGLAFGLNEASLELGAAGGSFLGRRRCEPWQPRTLRNRSLPRCDSLARANRRLLETCLTSPSSCRLPSGSTSLPANGTYGRAFESSQ